MYPVSAAYKTAIQQNVRDVKITGTITLKDDTIINIADEDIVQGSLYITEQCVSGEDIEVGNVYAAEMGLSLTTPLEDPYALDGARILLHFGLDVGGLWETVPLGYFYVTEIERKLLNVKLTALDGMLLFDVPCGQPGPGTPAGFVAHACSIAGVTLANAAEVATFANASIGVGEPGEKVKTCRDLLMWACQLMGAFARMDRQGQLEIVPIAMRASVKDIDKANRFKSDVSDFGVKITKVAMTVWESEYARGVDGMTLVLEENPMMAGLDASQINTVLDNLRAQVTKAVYVPFNSDFIGDPALQPGDYITIKDAGILESETETYFYSEHSPLEVQRNYVTSMITHSTWRYRGAHNIKAVGKSAMIRGVQQQQVKVLSSIAALAKIAQSIALAANQSAQLINDAIGGHVLIRQAPDETNEILIMDHPDPELAVKIWRWNMGGLGYSDNCTGADNPERTYTVAITMDGAINANFIKAGMIGAQYITIGTQTTFEEGYDPSKLQPVGMAADSNCTGLWHFDGSLNSHKGIPAVFDGEFADSKWGQGLKVDADKTLKIPTADILHPEESSVNMLAYNLAGAPNGAVIFDLGDDDGNQAVKVGIANDGRLFIEDKKATNIAYGLNKSELTGWDNLVLQWKADRLSLVVNGEENVFIENPAQVTALADYAFIGSDKTGLNQIGTTVDELRIDRIYQPIDKVNAWHIVDAPFYTSEEFAQWPGYVRVETDGLKVYDSFGELRAHLGSWLESLMREYGLRIIRGLIEASKIIGGSIDISEGNNRIHIEDGIINVYNKTVGGVEFETIRITNLASTGAIRFFWYDNGATVQSARISGIPTGLFILGDIEVADNFKVNGVKNCIEHTDNYGAVALSARESPEIRYIDEGIGTLVSGECRIDVDPIFLECIEPDTEDSKWYVDLTPYGKAHIYLDEIGNSFFVVKDWDGTANIRFKWTLSAVRKNYGHIRFQEVI